MQAFQNVQRLAAVTALTLGATLAQAADGDFSEAQQQAIGKIAADYLVAHPEVLVQASQALQAKRQEQQVQALANAAVADAKPLLNDAKTPAVGPKDASVSVVEFFDYQCVYCYHMADTVEKLVEANPKVRFVFKEFPVFGSRWPASLLAAEAGQYVYAQKGAKAYLDYHNGVYATGHNEGQLQETDIAGVLGKAGIDLNKVKAQSATLQAQLQGNMKLGGGMGVSGTPTFIVMPSKNPSIDKISVIPGAADQDALQKAIDKARS